MGLRQLQMRRTIVFTSGIARALNIPLRAVLVNKHQHGEAPGLPAAYGGNHWYLEFRNGQGLRFHCTKPRGRA